MDKFIARYYDGNNEKVVFFNAKNDTEESAKESLKKMNIQNFVIQTKPIPPTPFDENNLLFKGVVGFDITLEAINNAIDSGKGIILDSFGGDFIEGLKIYDSIKLSGKNPSIGVMGICASSAIQILISTENRWATENSIGAIHNPWAKVEGDDIAMLKEADNLTKSKNRLAKLYASVTGKTEEEMADMMQKVTIMDANEMLELNFIKEIKTTITNNNEVKLNNDEMKNEKELTEKVSAMEKVLNGLKNLFIEPSKVKNVMLTNADGKQIDFPEVEDESQIAVGDKATIDGAPATGEHVMASGAFEGKTFVFDNGTLSEIKEPEAEPNEEMEALKAENAELKKQLEAQNAFKKSTETQIGELTKQLNEFKSLVTSGDENDKPAPEVEKNKQEQKRFKYNFNTKN